MFTVWFNAVAVTAQQDLHEILCPTDSAMIIHEWGLSQNTEVGDAQEEQLLIRPKRGEGSVTAGSGGSSATPVRHSKGDAAAGATVTVNNTTKMAVGTGAIVYFGSVGWNLRVEKEKIYTPETRIEISPGDRFALELATTPADSVTMNGYVVFEEIGG